MDAENEVETGPSFVLFADQVLDGNLDVVEEHFVDLMVSD